MGEGGGRGGGEEGGVRRGNIGRPANTEHVPWCLPPPFYSSEWGAPPHFSSLPGGVCVDRAVQWISGHVIGNVRDTNLTKCPG